MSGKSASKGLVERVFANTCRRVKKVSSGGRQWEHVATTGQRVRSGGVKVVGGNWKEASRTSQNGWSAMFTSLYSAKQGDCQENLYL